MAINGLSLYGVALVSRGDGGAVAREATVIRFRDLGAPVRPAPYVCAECTPEELETYRRVIDAAFLAGAILPAPCGTVFRSADQVRQWLEQNYIALSEGIHFVAGRCEARVHISRKATPPPVPAPSEPPEGQPDADFVAVATDCFRLLRRGAVAAVPVRHASGEEEVLSGAFLLEHGRWADFAEQVREQARRYEQLTFEQTGPWPPYDFVRMDFGA
jgi:hypothetical protein